MDRSCLGTCCTEANGVRINRGCIEPVRTENCDIDIFAAAGVDLVGIAAWPNIDGHFSGALGDDARNERSSPSGSEKEGLGHTLFETIREGKKFSGLTSGSEMIEEGHLISVQ